MIHSYMRMRVEWPLALLGSCTALLAYCWAVASVAICTNQGVCYCEGTLVNVRLAHFVLPEPK